MKNSHKQKNVLFAVRFIPVAAVFLMTIKTGILLLGGNEVITELILIFCGFCLTVLFSRCLNFCALHRAMIYYAAVVMSCTYWQRFGGGFGQYIFWARLIVFMGGLTIIIWVVCDRVKNNCLNK